MDPVKFPKVEIRCTEGEALSPENAEVWIDGQRFGGVTRIAFEIDAGEIARLHLDVFGKLEISAGLVELTITKRLDGFGKLEISVGVVELTITNLPPPAPAETAGG